MASENETQEEILSEMRHPRPETLVDICPWWADGGDCVKCPLGGGGKLCIFNKLADRLDAARKRELLSKNAEYDNSGSVVVSGGKQGNAAVMREALEYMLHFDATDETAMEDGLTDAERIVEYADHIEECQKKANAALSAPLRNCDIYPTNEDAWRSYQLSHAKNADAYVEATVPDFIDWLFAPAEKGVA